VLGFVGAHVREDLGAAHARQLQVEQHDIGRGRLDALHGLGAVQHDVGVIARHVQDVLEERHDLIVVFDDQGKGFVHWACLGKSIRQPPA
jgi:hypothetical protein